MNYHFPQADFLSRRALAFSGIAAFHILIAYLLLTALVQAPPAKQTETRGWVIPEHDPPPVKLKDDFRPSDQHTAIRAPDVETLPPVVPESSPPSTVTREPPPAAGFAAAAVAEPVRVMGTNQLPNSEDYYPPDMRRLGIEGATNVRVCVDAQGARLGDPTIQQSSGYPRLDMAAMNVARHGRYARSLQGDAPVGNCFRFRIAFRIPK